MTTNSNQDGQGVVYRKMRGQYTVRANGRDIDCVLSSLLRKQLIYPIADPTSLRHRVQEVREVEHIDPVAIGDRVRLVDAGDGTAMINEVLPRKSTLSRPAPVPGQRVFEQVIVSNVDQVIPVFAAASPTPKWGLLDRYLVSAEASELPALIVVTKLDLAYKNRKLEADLETYRRIGYTICTISSVSGQGLDELKALLAGQTSVLIGKSGVGKTTLLNAIQPDLGLRVKEVSRGDLGKGRHTTTHLEMFSLDIGGALVDTPGMREFGLWDINGEDLALYFPEMAGFVGQCKFGLSCQHDTEPGCLIRQAVMDEKISPYRYKSYLNLRGEL
jgi:ribosome biogenesis GTPase